MTTARKIEGLPDVTGEERARAEAERFIAALTDGAATPVTWQTFSDKKDAPSKRRPQVVQGSLADCWDRLLTLNQAGHGIFIMVNEGDGEGRAAKNVTALRALFVDDDSGALTVDALKLAPSIVVRSKNGLHAYWRLQDGAPLDAFTPAQEALVRALGTDPAVKDLPRVMRVPGFLHMKDPDAPFMVRVVLTADKAYTIAEVLEGLGATLCAPGPASESVNEPVNEPSTVDASAREKRARAYAANVPGAVQGKNGDRRTYALACAVARGFDLDEATAVRVLAEEFNPRCKPPWTEKELAAKVRSALKNGEEPIGGRLKEGGAETTFIALGMTYQIVKGVARADKTSANVEAALVHLLSDRLELDERAGTVTLDGKRFDEGSTRNRLVADLCSFLGWHEDPRKDTLRAGIAGAASRYAFDPVVRYLDALPPWDRKRSVIPDLAQALGVEVSPQNIDLLTKWLIGTVRRAREPGIKMDTTLVLQGAQGAKKTSALEALALAAGDGVNPLFTRASQRLRDKDSLMKLQGPWIVELAELATVKGAENEHTKQYLDEREDFYRPPYGDTFIRRPRRVAFAGTTNEAEYLSDSTGARRYWLLRVEQTIDLDWIRANADRVWAEADARARAGEPHWYEKTPEWLKQRHEEAHEEGALEEIVEEIVAKHEAEWKQRGHFRLSDVLYAVNVEHSGRVQLRHADEWRIGRKLRRLGFEK